MVLFKYSALSNSLGQIYAFYNSPYDEESISKKVTNVTVGGNTTLTLDEPIPADTKTSSITTYQILKHDGVFGTTGLKLTAATGENDPVFTDDPTKVIAPCVVGTTAFEDAVSRFDNAIAYVEVDEGSSNIVRYRRKVIGVIDHFETDAAEPIGSQDERGDLVKISFLLDYQIPSLQQEPLYLFFDPAVTFDNPKVRSTPLWGARVELCIFGWGKGRTV